MSLLGKTIKLKGISQKGKNRIRQVGDDWIVFAVTEHILFAPTKSGPWLFISPKGTDHNSKSARWIREYDDPDFEVQGRPKIDISDCPGLSKAHFDMILREADSMKNCPVSFLKEILEKNRKTMYIDDYPGLRGESQIKVAAARYDALSLKFEEK